MWRRALVHCAPAFRPSRATVSCRSCDVIVSKSLRVRAISSPQHYSRFLSNDTSVASSDPTTKVSGAPGVESSGEKFVMVYTCGVCETRSAKTISKHAYYKGVVLVRCPDCENLHLVADRLGWFEDDSTDVESLMQQKGEKVRFVTAENVLELTEKDIVGDRNN